MTQSLLGAAIGQAAFGRRLGARVMVYGAVGGVIPDLDVVATAPNRSRPCRHPRSSGSSPRASAIR